MKTMSVITGSGRFSAGLEQGWGELNLGDLCRELSPCLERVNLTDRIPLDSSLCASASLVTGTRPGGGRVALHLLVSGDIHLHVPRGSPATAFPCDLRRSKSENCHRWVHDHRGLVAPASAATGAALGAPASNSTRGELGPGTSFRATRFGPSAGVVDEIASRSPHRQ